MLSSGVQREVSRLGTVPWQLGGYAAGADLGTASPATCWSDNVRRQQSAGDRMHGRCILRCLENRCTQLGGSSFYGGFRLLVVG